MQLGSVGYNYIHETPVIEDHPAGLGCGLILIVKKPSKITIKGKDYEITGKTCFIINPDTPYHYETYGDDWIYFGFGESDSDLLSQLGILTDTPIGLSHQEDISEIVRMISYEFYRSGPHHLKIASDYLDILLLRISEEISGVSAAETGTVTTKDALMKIRNHIYSCPEKLLEVEGYCYWTNLSLSGFQHAYKKLFGVNILSDIQESRLSYAKKLLRGSSYTVGEISEKCGYESEFSFMRWFKQKTGYTAKQYRDTPEI